MAGRVPQDAEREAVAAEMEATFIENLRHAADVLAQVKGEWVLCGNSSKDGELLLLVCGGCAAGGPLLCDRRTWWGWWSQLTAASLTHATS